jgi:hypothetical protein
MFIKDILDNSGMIIDEERFRSNVEREPTSHFKNKIILPESVELPTAKKYKHVRIPEDLYNELLELGGMGDSFGDLIERLAKFWKENHHKKRRP